MTASILQFTPRDLPKDGGKARHYRKRNSYVMRTDAGSTLSSCDDLIMDHADNGMPSDSPYFAPDSDGA